MMDDGHQGIGDPAPQPMIEPEERGVGQFVLEQRLEGSLAQTSGAGREIVQEAPPVRAPGRGYDFHWVPRGARCFTRLRS